MAIGSDGKCDGCGHRGFFHAHHLEFTETPQQPLQVEVGAKLTDVLECGNCGKRHVFQTVSGRWS